MGEPFNIPSRFDHDLKRAIGIAVKIHIGMSKDEPEIPGTEWLDELRELTDRLRKEVESQKAIEKHWDHIRIVASDVQNCDITFGLAEAGDVPIPDEIEQPIVDSPIVGNKPKIRVPVELGYCLCRGDRCPLGRIGALCSCDQIIESGGEPFVSTDDEYVQSALNKLKSISGGQDTTSDGDN